MDLFEYKRQQKLEKESPLAARMRPDSLSDFVGQEHIVGKNTLLYRSITADKLSSIILYGPPGTGKTTLAHVIAHTTSAEFRQINATTAGKKDITDIVEQAKTTIATSGKRTILFIDEIHRFNKAQQDALLPYVEDGTVILIGATTENPYFEVNKALVSRSIIFELKHLTKQNIGELINRALKDDTRGYGNFNINMHPEAAEFIADVSNGDARVALNALELAVLTTQPDENNVINIDLETAEQCIQRRSLNYDKDGDNHYDTVSAFIKSMRGSDPDAAVYYLAKMLYAGEDPRFIARRIVICASEDVGNADPRAISVAVAAAEAVNFIGLPECRINLAQAAAYVACAPKSNASCVAIDSAMEAVKHIQTSGVPNHLRDRHYPGAAEMGHGDGYKYAHDFPLNYVEQQYLPDELVGTKFYTFQNGYEIKLKDWMNKIKQGRGKNEND